MVVSGSALCGGQCDDVIELVDIIGREMKLSMPFQPAQFPALDKELLKIDEVKTGVVSTRKIHRLCLYVCPSVSACTCMCVCVCVHVIHSCMCRDVFNIQEYTVLPMISYNDLSRLSSKQDACSLISVTS